MPRCTIFSYEPDQEALFENAAFAATSDWFESPLPFPLSFIFALSPAAVFFGARIQTPAFSAPGSRKGEFVERLWEHDVIELFLLDDNGTAYQEFNLAPNGAWWTEGFESYRKPQSPQAKQSTPMSIVSEIDNGETYAWMSYPRSELAVHFSGSERSRANLCAILGKDSRRYVSYHHPAQPKPDFHLEACFGEVRIHRPH